MSYMGWIVVVALVFSLGAFLEGVNDPERGCSGCLVVFFAIVLSGALLVFLPRMPW